MLHLCLHNTDNLCFYSSAEFKVMIGLIVGGVLAVALGIIVCICLAISSKRDQLKKDALGKKRKTDHVECSRAFLRFDIILGFEIEIFLQSL